MYLGSGNTRVFSKQTGLYWLENTLTQEIFPLFTDDAMYLIGKKHYPYRCKIEKSNDKRVVLVNEYMEFELTRGEFEELKLYFS